MSEPAWHTKVRALAQQLETIERLERSKAIAMPTTYAVHWSNDAASDRPFSYREVLKNQAWRDLEALIAEIGAA